MCAARCHAHQHKYSTRYSTVLFIRLFESDVIKINYDADRGLKFVLTKNIIT
jgi:hypothetical protein